MVIGGASSPCPSRRTTGGTRPTATVVALIALVFTAAPAGAEWYLDAGLGFSQPHSTTVRLKLGDERFVVRDANLDTYLGGYAKVGHWWGPWAIELQGIFRRPDLDTPPAVLDAAGVDLDPDSIHVYTLGVSGLRRFTLLPRLDVHAGLGIGVTAARMREHGLDDTAVGPTAHGMAGSRYVIWNGWGAGGEVQLSYTHDLTFRGRPDARPNRITFNLLETHYLFGVFKRF